MNRRFFHLLCSLSIAVQFSPMSLAAGQPELNFKVYSPQDSAPASSSGSAASTKPPAADSSAETKTEDKNAVDSLWNTDAPTSSASPSTSTTPAASAPSESASPATTSSESSSTSAESSATTVESAPAETKTSEEGQEGKKKLLQGYIRVVPSGTKIPIIMDTAIDTDTSQEGDEFAARTGEDLNIDGSTVVPAGSVIKGRIAQLNSPKNLGRSGSVALKFDTVTTPDNRQIPLVANLVARGGVVHAKRGLKDIAIDTGTFVLPTAIGIGIGALAGGASSSSSTSSSSLGRGGGALIGAGVGAGVGLIILAVKKGKKVDVRPGDELKIELAEDLRMPM